MRLANYHSKINTAQNLIESFKENVMEIFWEEDPFEFCSSRSILPLIQEDVEYSIKKLHLKEKDQNLYIQKIGYLLGEFSED